VAQVFERGAKRLDEFHRSTGRQFDALRQELNAELEQILTLDQRVRFRERMPRPPDRGRDGMPGPADRRPPPPPLP
jgi:hypothetical protein